MLLSVQFNEDGVYEMKTWLTEAQLQASAKEWERKKKSLSTIEMFVYHSEMISGRGFHDMYDWQGETVERHVRHAKDVMSPGCNFIGTLQLINSSITGRHSDWLRTGVDAGFRGEVPEGHRLPGLLADLDAEVVDRVPQLREHPVQEREAFAEYVHNMIFCFHAFKEANSRTARVAMNHVRVLMHLEPRIIRYEESAAYLARWRDYKYNHFIPKFCPQQVAA